MTKTLKTFINTGLLILFVSHSYGMVFNLNDIDWREGANGFDYGEILLSENLGPNHSEFNRIDDTFNGSLTLNFTLEFNRHIPNGSFLGVGLENLLSPAYGDSQLSIGSSWGSDYWNGYRVVNGVVETLDFGTNQIVEGQSQEFTLTIDYNAGALDSGTLIIAGDPTVYDIGDYDYSFHNLIFKNGGSGSYTSGTNMSLEIVPEPATYALLSGALALVFVAVRRRFKA